MVDHQVDRARVQTLTSSSFVVALLVGLLIGLVPVGGQALAAGCDQGRHTVGCDDSEEEDGDDTEGSDEGGRPEQPRAGDTWDEYRYTECVPAGEDHPNEGTDLPSCYGGDPESCAEDEGWYWVDVRHWTYDGSEWTHGPGEFGDGWETYDVGCHSVEGEVTEDMVIRAVNSRELQAGEVEANPPGGKTLVSDFETIFFTEQGEYEFTLPLEETGTSVDIIATPTNYHWDFGDGGGADWPDKGRPYETGLPMSEYNTYQYPQIGTFEVELTIDYQVQWNDGDGWETIADPIQSPPSEPFDIQVLEKLNVLRSGN